MSNNQKRQSIDKDSYSMCMDNVVTSLESHQDKQCIEASFQAEISLKSLNNIAKRPPVNILFEEIGYTVSSNTGERRILQNVSGEFRAGELTCILGPSGAGKSTLLNILTGYTSNGVNGLINVNGHARNMKLFNKLSCYIMQDDLLQPRLTTLESMRIAAELKLGPHLTKATKAILVTEILQSLGLWNNRHTMCERLSGGQLKRLSIALELINNPTVIFLDEPTSGLDIVSARQLVLLLRSLSHQGRTIVCTIHQPSAAVFRLFDNIYVVCKGQCCYQGSASNLLPFLHEAGYICPSTYNPADFVIETLVGLPSATTRLSDLCQNGKIFRKSDSMTSSQGWTHINKLKQLIHKEHTDQLTKTSKQNFEIPISFATQFRILLTRMYIQGKRNRVNVMIQFIHHLICAFLIGGTFYLIGNEGSTPMVNFKFFLSVLVFYVYTHTMTPILLFPTEVRIVRREYFNHWYGLKAFYAALSCSTIPMLIFHGTIFASITYVMSGQLLEWNRFILFCISCLLTGFCSEGLGLVIGSALNITNGSIVGPATVAPLLALCCYGMGYGSFIEPSMKFLMSLSYLRYGLAGLTLPMYQNRTGMHCNEDVCPYANTELLLRDLGMATDTYSMQIIGLLIFIVFYRVLAYFILYYRLTTEYSNKVVVRISKFLKY